MVWLMAWRLDTTDFTYMNVEICRTAATASEAITIQAKHHTADRTAKLINGMLAIWATLRQTPRDELNSVLLIVSFKQPILLGARWLSPRRKTTVAKAEMSSRWLMAIRVEGMYAFINLHSLAEAFMLIVCDLLQVGLWYNCPFGRHFPKLQTHLCVWRCDHLGWTRETVSGRQSR